MMLNKMTLYNKLENKFRDFAFRAIVTECFMNALPFKQESFDTNDISALKGVSSIAIESVGGFVALSNAICTTKNEQNKRLLCTMYNLCEDIAKEAATRVCEETPKDTKEHIDVIVDKAVMTPEETKKFVRGAGDIDVEGISEFIKEKTKEVITDEQKAYDAEEEVKREIAEVLDTTDEAAIESSHFMTDFNKTLTREHKSLFSTIQSVACEMCTRHTNDEDNVEYKVLNEVVTEGFLDIFKKETKPTLEAAIECAINNTKVESDIPANKRMDIATLVSTITYTLVETLKSLGIYEPSITDVKGYVNKTQTHNDFNDTQSQIALERCASYIEKISKTNLATLTPFELTEIKESLTNISETLPELTISTESSLTFRNNQIKLSGRASALCGSIDEQLKKVVSAATESKQSFDAFECRKDSTIIKKFDGIAMKLSNLPAVESIQISLNKDLNNGNISIEGLSADKTVIGGTVQIALENDRDRNVMVDGIKKYYGLSKMNTLGKPVTIKLNDARGQKVTM